MPAHSPYARQDHYIGMDPQPIVFMRGLSKAGAPYDLIAAVKYISRATWKGRVEDLQKAIVHIQWQIDFWKEEDGAP